MLDKQKSDGFCLDIYLTDDGSTDGTTEKVRDQFKEVNVLQGDGSLYWNGGMRLAWNRALKEDYDFYLWVNDDSFIYPDAIANLLKTYTQLTKQQETVGVILGSMVDPESKSLTYGGRLKGKGLNPLKVGPMLEPTEQPIRCDFVNGNLTLIPSSTVREIGILSEKFTHSMGDFDFGLRANNAGLVCWVAPGIYGECKDNPIEGSWEDRSIDIEARIQKMQRINQLPPLDEWYYFVKQHGGKYWPLMYLDSWLRGHYPKLWLRLKRKL